jgi:hypothetical protein
MVLCAWRLHETNERRRWTIQVKKALSFFVFAFAKLVGDKHLLGEVYSGDPSADSLVIRTSIRTPLIPNRSEEEFGEDCG